MEAWHLNLSMIPGIAVILSSTNRMVLGLTDEINNRLLSRPDAYYLVLPKKIQQLKRLSISIALMYISIVLILTHTLLLGMDIIAIEHTDLLIYCAISIFFLGVYYQLVFAIKAYSIRQEQFREFIKPNERI
ncbi:MAG: hypothetical protein KG003_00605 [Bacteroidetes bacterium]|nr:hypothetical protein [Bacteroidota bacterium]